MVLLLAALGVAALTYIVLQTIHRRKVEQWPVSIGLVTAVRTGVSQVRESEQGSRVVLQAKICVMYSARGHSYTRWFSLPPRTDLTRTEMDTKSAQLVGSHCVVHWKEKQPMQAFVTEYATF